MMRLSQAAQALGVPLAGGDVEFTAVCTDSRTVRRGDLFVALRGERFDGHEFVAQAAAAGASAAMVESAAAAIAAQGLRERLPLLVVADTLKALGQLARHWRRQFSLPLVALTGSTGKTTVKEMLAAILWEACGASRSSRPDRRSCVLATRGNLNNHIGVPLTLLELRREHRYAVIEMGMNHTGEISYVTRLAEPDVAVITNAGRAHLQFLGSAEAIAHAKGEIFEGLKADGVAVINADERYAPLWRELSASHTQLEFGLAGGAAVSASYRLRELDSEIVLRTPLGEASMVVPAPGLHNVSNALAASAAASALRVPVATVAAGLARFPGVKGRLQRVSGVHGATLIDDSYNANPDSVRAAITVLAQIAGTRLLVLGDMGELGPQSTALHAEVGAFARESGIERLFTLGAVSAAASQAFGSGACHFPRIEELLAEVELALAPGVTVLVKGSRSMQMERVVTAFAVPREERGERGEGTKP